MKHAQGRLFAHTKLPRLGTDAELREAFAARACVCGSHDLFAVEPGAEEERVEIGILVAPARAARAWCKDCWAKEFGPPS